MNAEQLAAVQSPAPWNFVTAGPGSGKTTIIVGRAKHLVALGERAEDMAFVTFTGVGGKVLRTRLGAAVGRVGFAGTLHALMLSLLRKSDPRWTLIPEDDAEEFLKREAKTLGYKGSIDNIQAARARWVSNPIGYTPELRVIRAFFDFMREERMLDYGMVLTEGLLALRAGRIALPPVLFVDEFQDSAPVDAAIYLEANPRQLFVVADFDQAIFRFRGARPDNVRDYLLSGHFRQFILSANYRCASRICDAANAVIQTEQNRFVQKTTVSATEFAGQVDAAVLQSAEAEAEAVTNYCAAAIARGEAPHEIAVLCRTNALANDLRERLRMARLPVAGTEVDRKPKDWRLLMLIIAQIASPNNWAIARMLVRERARIRKESVDDAEAELMKWRQRMSIEPRVCIGLPGWDVVRTVAANFSRHGVSTASHDLLAQRIRFYEPATPDDLLEAMRENPEAKSTRGINVMTAHGAKGEEWSTVVIAGAEQFRGVGEDLDDERRLMFVAITRAKHSLAVFATLNRIVKTPAGSQLVTRDPGPFFREVTRVAAAGELVLSK